MSKKKKLGRKLSPMALIFFLLLAAIVTSWVVYWIVPEEKYDIDPAGILEVFMAPIKGFVDSVSTLIFIFFVGAYIHVLRQTHALDALIAKLFIKLKNKESIFIAFIFILFAILGSFLGVWSVIAIPFYFLLIPLLGTAKYDKFTSLLIVFFASEIGIFASTVNPILINNAVELTDASVGSVVVVFSDGLVWRIISFIVLTIIGLIFTLNYAKKHRKQNAVDGNWFLKINEEQTMTGKKKCVLWVMLFTFSFMFVGLFPWDEATGMNGFESLGKILGEDFPYIFGQSSTSYSVISNVPYIGSWTLVEIAFLFFASSFFTAIVDWHGEKNYANTITNGFISMVPITLIISMASGITHILNETGIQKMLIDLIDNVNRMNGMVLIMIIFVVLVVLSLFIPSISALTKAVYPTLGPSLAHPKSTVTVSGSILCASFANGVIHLCAPISTTLIYGLNACDVSFKEYYKKMWWILLILFGFAIGFLLIGVNLPNEPVKIF